MNLMRQRMTPTDARKVFSKLMPANIRPASSSKK